MPLQVRRHFAITRVTPKLITSLNSIALMDYKMNRPTKANYLINGIRSLIIFALQYEIIHRAF